jgi:hypothetical protein
MPYPMNADVEPDRASVSRLRDPVVFMIDLLLLTAAGRGRPDVLEVIYSSRPLTKVRSPRSVPRMFAAKQSYCVTRHVGVVLRWGRLATIVPRSAGVSMVKGQYLVAYRDAYSTSRHEDQIRREMGNGLI